MSRISGIALLRKPAGLTSFEALWPVKERLDTDRVGHSGTLDRFASGLLVLLVGPYVRLSAFFSNLDKVYEARLRLGEETDTLDPEGRIISQAEPCSRQAFEDVIPLFCGEILQRPPAYSAIHVRGKRAHDRVRRGEEFEIPPRSVVIHELELLDFSAGEASIRVRCSSGTYVRSLARDIAQAAGTKAHLLELERLSVGPFSLLDARLPAEIEANRDIIPLTPSLARELGFLPLMLRAEAVPRFLNGSRLGPVDFLPSEDIHARPVETPFRAVFAPDGAFSGLLEEQAEGYRYRFVIGGRG